MGAGQVDQEEPPPGQLSDEIPSTHPVTPLIFIPSLIKPLEAALVLTCRVGLLSATHRRPFEQTTGVPAIYSTDVFSHVQCYQTVLCRRCSVNASLDVQFQCPPMYA